jgi:alkylated DNA repair dioxygenase AlkB
LSRSIRTAEPPPGFRYRTGILEVGEERELVERIRGLPLSEFEFHGYLAKRRVVYFGYEYRYDENALRAAAEIPGFLLPLRARAAEFAARPAEDLVHAMVAEYRPGTQIGWHRDKPVFGDVIGVSLLSSCVFRLRRRVEGGFERYALTVEPRSVYRLGGPARTDWYHSIPAVSALRYSITFRTLAAPGRSRPG